MVGGTIFFERSSGEDDHRWVIQREISRVLVLNPLWQKSGAQNTGRILLSLTPPSLLSRGTRRVLLLLQGFHKLRQIVDSKIDQAFVL